MIIPLIWWLTLASSSGNYGSSFVVFPVPFERYQDCVNAGETARGLDKAPSFACVQQRAQDVEDWKLAGREYAPAHVGEQMK